jgi:hypothetical protein
MAKWYALICLTDQLTPEGKLDYPAGAVKSFGTVLSGNTAELAAKGIEAVDIGEQPDIGPDFSAVRFNPVTKQLEALAPVVDPARVVMGKQNWTPDDRDTALREILKRFIGE